MPDSEALQERGDGAPAANVGQQIDRHEKALLQGDLSDLSNDERKSFYAEVCDSLGLNPMTQPLEYIWLSGDLTLYANKTAANQLRDLHGVSITDLDIQRSDGLHRVYAHAQDQTGRTDVDAGIVSVDRKSGEALANAEMKAITKAKRRVTLSICGLGFLDNTEVEDIPDEAKEPAKVDHETGEIIEVKPEGWYEDAIGWIKDLVREGKEPEEVLSHAGAFPEEHPIDEWPEEHGEQLVQWLAQGGESGKASRPSSNANSNEEGDSQSQTEKQQKTPHDGGRDQDEETFEDPDDSDGDLPF